MKRWTALLGCFIGMSVATPAILLVPMGLYLKSMTAEFGWSRTDFSTLIAIAALFNAIFLPAAGYLVDRFKPPRVIAVGTVLGCGSYAALALAHSYAALAITLGICTTTGNLSSYPAFMSLAQRWFDKRLGLAMAITSTGLAAGIGVSSYAIAKIIQGHGWRTAFVIVGMAAMAIGLLNLLFFVRDNKAGLHEGEAPASAEVAAIEGETLSGALRSRDFWLYSIALMLVVFAFVGCNVHLPALLSDRGASTTQIASTIALGSLGSLLGRLFTGVSLDRFSVPLVSAVFLLGEALSFLLLLEGLRWALPAGLLLGVVQGAEIDLLGFVMARRFGRLAYGRILGTAFAITLIGAITGPVVMAAVFDHTGSYAWGLMLLPLLPLFAFGLICMGRSSRGAAAIKVPLLRPL